jgi:hypothetical protein
MVAAAAVIGVAVAAIFICVFLTVLLVVETGTL